MKVPPGSNKEMKAQQDGEKQTRWRKSKRKKKKSCDCRRVENVVDLCKLQRPNICGGRARPPR